MGNTQQHYPAIKPFEYTFWWVKADDEPTNQLQTYVSRKPGLRRREDRTVKISVKSAAGEKHFKIKEHVAKEKNKNCISDKMFFPEKAKNFFLSLPPHRFYVENKIQIYLRHRRNCKWEIPEFLCEERITVSRHSPFSLERRTRETLFKIIMISIIDQMVIF